MARPGPQVLSISVVGERHRTRLSAGRPAPRIRSSFDWADRMEVGRRRLILIAGLMMLGSACASDSLESTPPGALNGDEIPADLGEAPTIDLSGQTLADNLLTKEMDGEWTRGEGLVATLESMVGSRELAEVLRHGDVTDLEGTGIVMMARAYLASGPDGAQKSQVAALLDRLFFSNERLEAMAGLDVGAAMGTGVFAAAPMADATEDCAAFFRGEPPPGVGACLQMRALTGVATAFQGPFRVFGPAPGMDDAGWEEEHYDLVLEALGEGVERYSLLEGVPELGIPAINVVLSTAGDAFASADPVAGEPCGVVLHTDLQTFTPGNFKHVMVHEIAHCLQTETFPAQNKVGYEFISWREEGLAEYLANLVYPNGNLEWAGKRMEMLEQVELSTTLLQRRYTNFMMFMFLGDNGGDSLVFDVVRNLPTEPGVQPQIDALRSYPGMIDLHQEFLETVTDEHVSDTGGGFGPYPMTDVNQPTRLIAEKGPVVAESLSPFGVVRRLLVVEPGKQACLEYDRSVLAFQRPLQGGEWSPLPRLLPMAQGEPGSVVMVASSEKPVSFTLDVLSVHDLTETDSGGDPTGEWIVDNGSLWSKVGFIAPVQQLDSISGQIGISFRENGTVELDYRGFRVAGHSEVALERGAFSSNFSSSYESVMTASGTDGYRVTGDYLFYDSLSEGDFIDGTDTVTKNNSGIFLGIESGDYELGVELPESTVDSSPAKGWAILGAANKFRLECNGAFLILDDRIVLVRTGP